jgi:DNA (cytosine-5)-methyltransferase 1
MQQNKPLTLGSLFDGSGGFPLGGLLAGITPVWASEIEPFPIRVTTKRLPFMKHYGDISAMDGGKIEPVDIICFGSPCQDMSLAGCRTGLDGSRSSLFYEAIRIIKEMRCATDGRYPKWICWENVPGAFSSNSGEDFRTVLESICRIADEHISVPRPAKWSGSGEIMGDGFSVAWRQLDAQYFPGTPQRRKRIYLVGDFTGGSAGKILFESEGLSGYSSESLRSWQRTAFRSEKGTSATGIGFDGYNGVVTDDVAATLGVNCGMSTGRNGIMEDAIPLENYPIDGRCKVQEDGMVQTLTSRMGTGGNNVPLLLKIRSGCEGGGKGPLIQKDKSATLATGNDQTLFQPMAVDCRNLSMNPELSGTLQAKSNGGHSLNYQNPVVYGICAKDSNAMKSSNPHSGFYEAETTRCLDGNGGNPTCNQGGMAVVALEGNGSRPSHKGDGYKETDVMYTLNATEQHAVAHPTFSSSKASFFTSAEEELANTLVATDYKDPPLINDTDGLEYIVRRLTPTECARLQGFPDWWCSDLGTEKPSDAEVYEWYKIFETYRKVTGSGSKPKSDKQIRAFLADPHSDSAEYKMWGNGVALPCVYLVLSGIAWIAQLSSE